MDFGKENDERKDKVGVRSRVYCSIDRVLFVTGLAESLVDLGEVIQGTLLAFGKYSIAGVDPSSAHNFSGVIHSIKVGPEGLRGGRRSEKRREN